MSSPHETFDTKFAELIDQVTELPLDDKDTTTALRNLDLLSKFRPPEPKPEPTPEPVMPMTRMEKATAAAARVLDNETARTAIKAVGAFAGVALVAYTTIRRDHVIERQALQQANQRPS